MGNPHGGRVLLHVLAAVARGVEHVHADIVGVDLDFDSVAHVGDHLHQHERGMPPLGVIERRDAHQPVDAALGAQIAVGVAPTDFERGAFDARLFALGLVNDLGVVLAALGPAQVHAHQHLGPILRLGAAGAGIDVDDGVAVVVRARHHRIPSERRHLRAEFGHIGGDLAHQVGILFGFGQVEQLQQFVGAALDRRPGVDFALQRGDLLHHLLGGLLLIPKAGGEGSFVQLGDARFLARQVKDAPSIRSTRAASLPTANVDHP